MNTFGLAIVVYFDVSGLLVIVNSVKVVYWASQKERYDAQYTTLTELTMTNNPLTSK